MSQYINKGRVAKVLTRDHQKFNDLISQLNSEQMTKTTISGEWVLKDVIAHLSAWYWEYVREIDRVLKDQATWQKPGDSGDDEFNKKETLKRKEKSVDEILEEWENSFSSLLKRIDKLTSEEWNHQSDEHLWNKGNPVTVFSLFSFEAEGLSHEGQHAKQLEEILNKLN